MKMSRKMKRWAIISIAFIILAIDLWIAFSRPVVLASIAYGRLAVGIFIQFIAVGFLISILVKNGGSKKPYVYSLANIALQTLRILIPFLVISWIGSSLVSKSLHEGGVPLTYRGQR